MPFVLDCSMTMAWIFPDEATEGTNAVRDSLLEDTAIVPTLWSSEVANVLLAATRRGRIQRNEWRRLAGVLEALPIAVEPHSPPRALASILPLADECGLSVYDATYLELALRKHLPLATLDNALAEACRTAGVDLRGES